MLQWLFPPRIVNFAKCKIHSEIDMFLSFLSNDKAVLVPLASVHFTISESEGFTAYVAGTKYHPIDPRSLEVHEPSAVSKTALALAEKARLASYARA